MSHSGTYINGVPCHAYSQQARSFCKPNAAVSPPPNPTKPEVRFLTCLALASVERALLPPNAGAIKGPWR
jgi:hypothetical protein